MFAWSRRWRRERLLREPFPDTWTRYIEANVRHFQELDELERNNLKQSVQIIVAERNWEGCDGFDINDEVQVTIAAQAGLLILGLKTPYYFDRVRSVLVYPGAFSRTERSSDGLIVDENEFEMLGEAWEGGTIILSWPDVVRGGRNAQDGRNLVLHEFAHHLDGLDGEMGGSPPLAPNEQKRWFQVTEREYERLACAADRGMPTLLDQYGATNKAEFFAVSTECFFEQPIQLQQKHPDLYDILHSFYQQDPATRRRRRG